MRPLHTKVLFKRKRNVQETIRRYKARLVVPGNEKTVSNNYNVSSVADFTVSKMVVCLAVQNSWYSTHLDFDNAFPNGKHEWSGIIVSAKHYYSEAERSSYVLRLNRSLYGLKYAAPICNQAFSSLHWYRTSRDASRPLYVLKKDLADICYVDDLIVFADSEQLLKILELGLSAKIKVKDIGRRSRYLGIELDRCTAGTILLKQANLIKTLFRSTGTLESKPAGSPVDPSVSHEEAMLGGPLPSEEHTRFRSLTGSFLYSAQKASPDLRILVSMRDSNVATSWKAHMVAAKRGLRYLNATAQPIFPYLLD